MATARPPRSAALTRRARRSRVERGRFVQALLAANGLRWPDLEAMIAAIYRVHVRPGDTVLDIGVNHGQHLVPLAEAVGPAGRVVGFEAVPAFAAHVRALLDGPHAHLRDRVTLHEGAVSAAPGRAEFFVTSITDGGMSGLRLRPVIADAPFERIEVEVRTVDALIDGLPPIRFAKIDVEGAEYAALTGARALLAQTPLVVFEMDAQAPAHFGFDADDLLGLLRGHGYTVHDIFGFEIVDGAAMVRGRVWNFVAVPPGLGAADVFAPAQAWFAATVPEVASLLPRLDQARAG